MENKEIIINVSLLTIFYGGVFMEKERQLGFEIRTLNNCVKRFVHSTRPPEFEESTGVHGWAIRYFYENRNKDIFQRDFEKKFSIRRSTASRMLKTMEQKGFIERLSVESDARLKKIVLTEKAVQNHEKIIESIKKREKLVVQKSLK